MTYKMKLSKGDAQKLKALGSHVKNVINVPVLRALFFEVSNGEVFVNLTSIHEVFFSAQVKLESPLMDDNGIVDAAHMPDGNIGYIKAATAKVVAEGLTITITPDKGDNFFGDSPEDMHVYHEYAETFFDVTSQKDFISTLTQVSKTCSKEDARPVLTTVFFNIKGQALELVSADGYRLTFATIGINQNMPDHDFMLESKTLGLLKKIVDKKQGELTISTSYSNITFAQDGMVFTMNTHEGRFPNYRPIVPKSFNTSVEIGNPKIKYMRGDFPQGVFEGDTLRLTNGDRDNPIERTIHLGDVSFEKVPLNLRYLTDATPATSKRVRFESAGEANPMMVRAWLKGVQINTLIMPMSLPR